MTTIGWILNEPWDWARLGEGNPRVTPGRLQADGNGAPRIIMRTEHTLRVCGAVAVVAGPLFEVMDGLRLRSWALPGDRLPGDARHDLTQEWSVGDHRGFLVLTDFLPRPKLQDHEAAAGEQSTQAKQAAQLESCVLWAMTRFQELAHGDEAVQQKQGQRLGGRARRTWDEAQRQWLRYEANDPTMDLIVRLARSQELERCLASVAAHPRQVLSRVRQMTRIGQVQELDAACIRAYARLPGSTPIERAGPRQLLLAVRRQASHDTLENRVAAWTLAELDRKARRWMRQHAAAARTNDKVGSVGRLARTSRERRAAPALEGVSIASLEHPAQPNYSLQFDQRYRPIYRDYLRLLKEKREEDDAWTWRQRLWADVVRQWISTTLSALAADGVVSVARDSAPLYWQESRSGSRLSHPSSFGPFTSGEGEWHVLDQIEIADLGERWLTFATEPWMRRVGALGADTILWCPQAQRIIVVWAILDTTDTSAVEAPETQRLQRANEALKKWLDLVGAASALRSVTGLVMSTRIIDQMAEPKKQNVEQDMVGSAAVRTIGVSMPMNLAQHADYPGIMRDLCAGLTVAIEP